MNYHIVSLGCPKNLIDSEIMMHRLERHGYQRTEDPRQAEVIVVNTCAFIRAAKEESIETILELARHKAEGTCKLLAVTGCLPQRYRQELPAEMPEVDIWIGTDEFPRLPEILDRSLQGERVEAFTTARIDYEAVLERTVTTPSHWAYLKISEGCNHTCRFCIIPKIRGHYRSRSMESIEEEARRLADGGARELVLIAQDITDYGRDRYHRRSLSALLDRLSAVPGVEWLRIMYAYPTSVDDSLIEVMARNRKVCRYLDIPLQHVSQTVLRSMGRPGNRDSYLRLIARFRAAVPDLALRTTFIVGYPGETQADFEELLAFMEEVRFDRVGVFEYSQEEDTPAARLPDQISRPERRRRFREAYRVQQQISHASNASRIGQVMRVLVDQEVPGASGSNRGGMNSPSGALGAADVLAATAPAEHAPESQRRLPEPVREAGIGRPTVKFPVGARYLGRTESDAPEIDGTVFLSGGDAVPGEFRDVRITGAHPYDLVGTLEPRTTPARLPGTEVPAAIRP